MVIGKALRTKQNALNVNGGIDFQVESIGVCNRILGIGMPHTASTAHLRYEVDRGLLVPISEAV